jgi:hypothetical protein
MALIALTGLAGCSSSAATPSTGSSQLKVSGTENGWTFHEGQTVSVSMGANKIFKPYSRLNIIECSDPGGTSAHLPVKYGSECDINTLQGDSVIVQPNGSFSESHYTVYTLPNRLLQETPALLPKCDATHQCVLYVGFDQNDFTKPKVFSHPFTITSGKS